MNETLIKIIKKAIQDANIMDRNDYLQKLLLLCNEKQMDMWDKMYPDGNPKDIDWAIKQVERGIMDVTKRCFELDNVQKEFDEYKKSSNKHVDQLIKTINEFEYALSEARSEISMLNNPINIKNAEVQKRLEKLDALEAGGVDNWEWYGEAMNRNNLYE